LQATVGQIKGQFFGVSAIGLTLTLAATANGRGLTTMFMIPFGERTVQHECENPGLVLMYSLAPGPLENWP